MSSWGLRLNPFTQSYSSLEADQMRFVHKAYCEAMEVGEEDLPAQLKMDDNFYPTYRPTVADFDENSFMRKMQDVVGLLRNPAEGIISTICAYQRERYERFSFGSYLNDPRTLLLEEFKDWAMRTLAPAACTTESILNEVRRRHAYILRLQHGQQGLFSAGSGERSLMSTLKDVRSVIETRVLPAIEAERAHSSAREQLHTLEARGTDGLMHGVQFLFYVFRNTPNTPADCTISNLQTQQHSGMKDAMSTKSGQMLQVLLTTPSFKALFPENPSMPQRDALRPLQLTADEEEEMKSTAVFYDDSAKPQVPTVLTRALRGNGKDGGITPVEYLKQSNAGIVALSPASQVAAYESFTRLHGLLKLLADLIVSCRKARQLAGPGGDLLIYGPGGEEVRRLMQSLEIVQTEISRIVTKLTQVGVRELDRLKPNQEKSWRWSFSKVLPLENYIAHDFAACTEPIQRMYANADPVYVQKMYKQFRQATGMWVTENNSICRHVHAALGAPFMERLPGSVPELEDGESADGPKIELLDDDAPSQSSNQSSQSNQKSSVDARSNRRKTMLLTNGPIEEGDENQSESSGSNNQALVVQSSAITKPRLDNNASLFSSAATMVSLFSNVSRKAKEDANSPQNSETDEDEMDKGPQSSNSSASSADATTAAAAAAGVLDVLLLVRQSIQRIGQLSWGLRTSFHTSTIDEGDFDAYIALCAIYQGVNVTVAPDLLIRLRHHRVRLVQLLKRHIGSVLNCVFVLQSRIVDEQKSIVGMNLVYRRLEAIMSEFEMDLDALITNYKEASVDFGKMKDGVLELPLSHKREDNTGVTATMYAYNAFTELADSASKNAPPSDAILSHGEYMKQLALQLDLHWNSISHLLTSLKGTVESVQTVCQRLREYAKNSRITVPAQQLDYIFEYNYNGFFQQSTKDLQSLLASFDEH